jgi:hypothetical protein
MGVSRICAGLDSPLFTLTPQTAGISQGMSSREKGGTGLQLALVIPLASLFQRKKEGFQ